ncbi:single-stranded DNA-binding protein [Cytobacillus purgationiresistens]|uniref:Single-stranded DNA-binding protein n=1 Tax=Cytobacillus purgationiresistens TaxID=863449 RepID=A0ABU0AJ10_9BACI|nr:single-stranded DNA-binding protein [Cytobacillus purgationiresistens]MDQ0271232.1 single-strand DNA-binding protein [Cytobacillus purgationiresistens]
MNTTIITGRLTKDPELRYTSSNKAVTSISIAVSRGYKNQQGEVETDFFNVVIWEQQAKNVVNYLNKGSRVAIEGRLQNRSYESDGRKVYITEIHAKSIEFLDSKNENPREKTDLPNNRPTKQNNQGYDNSNYGNQGFNNQDPFASGQDISDDDLPF